MSELQPLASSVFPTNGVLLGDDTIFADLGLSSKEYPKVMTTW